MPATDETVREYAQKYRISEEAVRDIAGLEPPFNYSVSVSVTDKGKATFELDGVDDGEAVVDFGDSRFETVKVKGGKVTHDYETGGMRKVRFDVDGLVRWVDVTVPLGYQPVEAEPAVQNTPPQPEPEQQPEPEPVDETPAPAKRPAAKKAAPAKKVAAKKATAARR